MPARRAARPPGRITSGEAAGRTPPKKVRRTHDERSGETQRRAVAAAVVCLHRHGFASTTTSQVADEAGISRGAMLHQFPTRAALMLAVVRHVFEDERAQYRQAFEAVEGGFRDKMLAVPEIMWGILSRPQAVAVLEILIEGRSDPSLSGPLAELQSQIEAEARESMLNRFPSRSFASLPEREAFHRLFVAAIRGLSIDALRMGDGADIRDCVALLRRLLELWLDSLRQSGAEAG